MLRLSLLLLLLALPVAGAEPMRTLRLDSMEGLSLDAAPGDAAPEVVTYRGRRALRLIHVTRITDGGPPSLDPLLRVRDLVFDDGVIEVDVVGRPRRGAPPDVRGFVGVAFRVELPSRYECIYVRQLNGRASNQLQRNHATQYMSEPDHPWRLLRAEAPGMYESYVDLEPDAWTHLRIVVRGPHAELFVNGATQPALVVNDLKHGVTRGGVALWVGSDTEATFSDLRIGP